MRWFVQGAGAAAVKEKFMSALLVGYARVSNHDQDLTAQQKGLAALGVSAGRTHVEVSMLPQSCSPRTLVAGGRPR